jgi:hypothetical protein
MGGRTTEDKISLQLGSGPGNLGGDAGKVAGDAEFDAALRDMTSPTAQESLSADSLLTSQLSPTDVSGDALRSIAEPTDKTELPDHLNNIPLDETLAPKGLAGGPRKGLGGNGIGDEGDGTGGGGDPNGTPGFFGIQSHGKSVVYVVDSSGSMDEHGKYKMACRELLRSIGQLTSKKKFFVILYSDGSYPMDADEPVPATPDKISQVREWLEQVQPNGGTQPLGALMYALSMKPDEIYFLSDGQFDASLVMELKRANPGRKIPIHTIALMNYQTTGMMKMIARHPGGKFRFVQ